MPAKIRPMQADDKPLVMDILRHTPEFKRHEVAVAEEVIDAYLRDPKGSGYFVLVAGEGPAIDGFICYGPTPCTTGTWDIYWEAVSRQRRGRGIGAALTRAAEAAVRKGRGRLILIETSATPAYENTRLFYRGRGYEEIARIPDFYAPGDAKITVQKRLRENK
jgi:ribosomal protein S18 acetylase RimI-like enzyme